MMHMQIQMGVGQHLSFPKEPHGRFEVLAAQENANDAGEDRLHAIAESGTWKTHQYRMLHSHATPAPLFHHVSQTRNCSLLLPSKPKQIVFR